jgi:hypothetical protein
MLSLLGVFSANLVIHSNEMTPEMRDHAIATALEATENLPKLDDFANNMVKEFNKKYGQNWQCIVSNDVVGLNVSHESGTLISFTILQTNVILFKSMHSQEKVNETSLIDQVFACSSDESCTMVKKLKY